MSRLYSGFFRLQISLALTIATASLAHAAGWSDDFDDGNIADGNPVTWSTSPHGMFPGTYDASSGDLILSAHGDTNGNGDFNDEILVAWVEDMAFENVYIRAQGTILPGPAPGEDGGNLALLGRLDATFLTGYDLYLDSGGSLVLQLIIGEDLTDLASVQLPELNALSEVIMELNIVGSELSGYAWRAGDPKPAAPQVTATNGVFLIGGDAGIAYAEDDDNTTGIFRWVMAQDTPFVDALPGDFNGDGSVDAADYVVWRKGEQGGTFDQDDYNSWRMNFGAPAGSGSLVGSAVPEPGALIQFIVAIAAFLAGAVRRRSLLG